MFWIVIVAITVRLLVIFVFHTYRFGPGQPYNFGYEMGRIGRSIAQGNGFGNIYGGLTGPTAYEPPLYPYIVGGVFKLCGVYSPLSAFVLLSINAVFSALTCIPIVHIAKRCFGETTAVGSAWTWAFYPFAIYWSTTWIWETVLSTMLLAVLFWVTLAMDEYDGLKPWIWFGVLWGVAVLTNPSLISFLLASGLWAARQFVKRNKPWLPGAVVASLVFFACLTPWQIRNYQIFKHFFFIRHDFGMILRMGNGPEAQGAWLISLMPSRNPAEFARYVSLGETAYAAAQGQQALQFIKQNPGHFVVLCAKRFLYYWAGNPRPSLFQAAILTNLFEIATSVIYFWGLIRALRKRVPGAWLFFWLILLYPVVYYITYPNIRYREPLEPYMIIMGISLSSQPRKHERRSRPSPVAAAKPPHTAQPDSRELPVDRFCDHRWGFVLLARLIVNPQVLRCFLRPSLTKANSLHQRHPASSVLRTFPASPVWLGSVSCSRSSNRTGGFPASGSRKRHTMFRVTPPATSEHNSGWLDSSSIPMSCVASCVRL
jgi:4-amino-4-deoxy-L-arabinose transferase-like glycosyltransferase